MIRNSATSAPSPFSSSMSPVDRPSVFLPVSPVTGRPVAQGALVHPRLTGDLRDRPAGLLDNRDGPSTAGRTSFASLASLLLIADACKRSGEPMAR